MLDYRRRPKEDGITILDLESPTPPVGPERDNHFCSMVIGNLIGLLWRVFTPNPGLHSPGKSPERSALGVSEGLKCALQLPNISGLSYSLEHRAPLSVVFDY